MTPENKAYLDGLYHAALLCEQLAKDQNSRYAAEIMKFRMTEALRLENVMAGQG